MEKLAFRNQLEESGPEEETPGTCVDTILVTVSGRRSRVLWEMFLDCSFSCVGPTWLLLMALCSA